MKSTKEKWLVLCMLNLASMAGLVFEHCSEAADSLSLDQAVQEGLENSPSLKKAESSKSRASWIQFGALSNLLPQVFVKAKHDFAVQYQSVPVNLGGLVAAVPVVYPRTSWGAEARWTLFDGLANVNRFQGASDLLQAAGEEYSRKNFEIRKKIQLTYFSALAAQKFQDVAEENVKTLQENMSQVQYRMQSGVATQYDVLRVEVQLSDASTELIRTRDNVIITRKKLAEAMGLREDSRSLVGQLRDPSENEKVSQIQMPDASQRQDFVAARLRSQAAQKESSATTGELVPQVVLSAQYENYENTGYPGEAYGGFRDAWGVGVYAKWNILDAGASLARAGAARASAAYADYEYQEKLLSLPSDFELWKRRYLYSSSRFGAKNQDLKRSQESFRIATLLFQQGRKTITDVLEAETDLFRARAGVVQSQLDAEEARVELELTVGKEI